MLNKTQNPLTRQTCRKNHVNECKHENWRRFPSAKPYLIPELVPNYKQPLSKCKPVWIATEGINPMPTKYYAPNDIMSMSGDEITSSNKRKMTYKKATECTQLNSVHPIHQFQWFIIIIPPNPLNHHFPQSTSPIWGSCQPWINKPLGCSIGEGTNWSIILSHIIPVWRVPS